MEAWVPQEKWGALKNAFDQAMSNRPHGVISSWLAQDIHDRGTWRISTRWVSHEVAMAHYEAGEKMPSMHTFHLVGIVPHITISDVIDNV